MKKLVVGILLLLLTVNVHAQWYNRKYGINDLSEISETQLTQALQETKEKIIVGKLLTIAGVGCEIVGLILIANNFCIMDCSDEEIAAGNAGGVLFAAGFIAMGIGIPIWAVNGSRRNKIEFALIRFNTTSFSSNNQPTYLGYKQPSTLGLSVKFNF